MHSRTTPLLAAVVASATVFLPIFAQDETGSPTVDLPPLTVVGSEEAALSLPGAGAYLSTDDIRTLGHGDIHRILKTVPGVYVREEEGFGLFPNVSLRGTSIGRSEKVTLMEDGVLAAPGPYSAPSAYYSPAAGRMSAVEVLKGSSQIQHGPHTTGGVLNYLSTPIPDERETYLNLSYGTDADRLLHLTHGGRRGDVGYLAEFYGQGNDGFKRIDATAATPSSDDTGFERIDGMLRLSWQAADNARIELKAGRSETDANETYLGLSDADFDANPFRRYAASRFDNFENEQEQLSLRHHWAPTDDLRLTTTIYYHDLHRNWYKLNDLNLGDGSKLKIGPALASAAGLAVLKGEAAGTLNVKANNRDYEAKGVETRAVFTVDSGPAPQEIEVGVRLHSDERVKFQHVDQFVQGPDGAITATKPGAPGSSDDTLERADAVAVYLRDRLTFGRLSVTPGLRVEHVDYALRDRKSGKRADNDLTALAPGIGFNLEASDDVNVFGGVYRGISVPGVGGATRATDPLEEERSLGLELGLHVRGEAFRTETTAFYTDFSDLIVPDNVGGGGGGDDENAGDIVSYGLEWKGTYDLGAARGWAVNNPWFTALTYTHAELDGDAESTSDGSVFHGGKDGNEVPYIPELQFVVGTAVEHGRWSLELSGNYVDSVWSTAANATDPANGKIGRVESRFVLDLSVQVQLDEKGRLAGSVHNLTDEEYMVGRHPEGPRPGRPLTATIGYERTF